jgi:hypothetical protein
LLLLGHRHCERILRRLAAHQRKALGMGSNLWPHQQILPSMKEIASSQKTLLAMTAK